MSLYLCVLSIDDGVENERFGVEIGTYEYFGRFRDYILEKVENKIRGSICPILMMHSDCDGVIEWCDSERLISELNYIKEIFEKIPPDSSIVKLRCGVIEQKMSMYSSLYDCFTDIDGCNLLNRLIDLFKFSVENQLNVYFQ